MSMMELQYRWSRTTEKIQTWIAWHLPRKIAYWCFIRVHTNGPTGREGPSTEVVATMDAWEPPHG